MGSRVEVDLLGTSFSIQTDQDPKYVSRIIGYLRGKIEELEESAGTTDRLRIAILSAILVADELFRERSRQGVGANDDGQHVRELTEKIIDRIDTVLED